MTTCIKVPLAQAEEVKKQLIACQQLDTRFLPTKKEGHIYFPVQKYTGETLDYPLSKREEKQGAVSFKESLERILTPEEMQEVKTAHDIMGSVAIIEVPDSLAAKERLIATTLLDANPLIKTVLKKGSGHEGVYRTQHMVYLAGEETKEATYKENNCTFIVDVQDVYFSSRLATERKRIAEQVNTNEHILVMFSGAAPYPCVLAKNTPAKHIIGVEINPKGHEYGLANVTRNKVDNVTLYCGDVRNVVPTLNQTFDRIIMPLPRTAEEFLDVALPVANKHARIHLYGFYHVDEFDKAKQEIKKHCEHHQRTYIIDAIVKSGQQSPRTYRICVDIQLTN
jgi:tRNA (guanine37-N1)-methyltransferase